MLEQFQTGVPDLPHVLLVCHGAVDYIVWSLRLVLMQGEPLEELTVVGPQITSVVSFYLPHLPVRHGVVTAVELDSMTSSLCSELR
jgi:hypothetical protein